jgi:hypothetical protein
MDRPTKPSGRHAVRLRWDEIITRLSFRFNFLAIRETEIVGGLRPPAPYAFNRPSSANFLRGFLCKVDLLISPRRQNAIFRVSISCEFLNCILMETEPMTVTR